MSAKTYYRIAERKHAKGCVMKGQGKRPLEDTEPLVEQILESHRPPDCPDRGDSVYMREKREFSTVGVPYDEGYVHEVEPIGRVDKRDLAWIGVIQVRHHPNDRLRKDLDPTLTDAQVAERYWSGRASEKPVWEWVTREARVIGVDNDPSRLRAISPLLDMFSAKPRK